MFRPVTDVVPELHADTRNHWTQIGEGEYYQSDVKNNITLEIRHQESGLWRWWLYDAKSSDLDLAVTLDDAPTLAAALAAVYAYLDGYA